MDNKKLLLALCFINASCSLKTVRPPLAPPWIQDASVACPSGSLCALGEGKSHREAAQSARESLAKILKTRIQGTTETLSSLNHTRHQSESLQTFDEILQGVRIVRRHRQQQTLYALASLNKKTSAQLILQKAKRMDELLLKHYQEGDVQAFLSILDLRQALQDRYFLLTGKELPPPISYQKMRKKMAAIRSFRSQKTLLLAGTPPALQQFLIENLSAQGYRTSEQSSRPYHLKLVAQVNSRQLHFNVSGFKKYEFSLQIKIYNSQGIQKNMLSLSIVQVGRSQEQAWKLAMKNILNGLEKNIDSLLKE